MFFSIIFTFLCLYLAPPVMWRKIVKAQTSSIMSSMGHPTASLASVVHREIRLQDVVGENRGEDGPLQATFPELEIKTVEHLCKQYQPNFGVQLCKQHCNQHIRVISHPQHKSLLVCQFAQQQPHSKTDWERLGKERGACAPHQWIQT